MAGVREKLANLAVQRLLLVVAVLSVYGISLTNGFVWDDKVFFIGNPVYQNYDLRTIFFSLGNSVEYQPLRDLTYVFDYLLWGERPFGFHFTNLLLFILNVLTVHYLAGQLTKLCADLAGRNCSTLVPLLAAALFAVHPLNAEAVNFITCRNVLVSGVFFFVSVILVLKIYTNGFSWRVYISSLAAFICAMVGKTTALMLPFLLLALLPLLFPGQRRRLVVLLSPYFLVAAGFFLLAKTIAERADIAGSSKMAVKMATALQIPVFYLYKLVFPQIITVEYVTGFTDRLFSLQVLLAFSIVALLIGAALLACRRFPEVTVGLCWYFIALLPVLNFFATYPTVADRYVFLPLFGMVLVVAMLVERISVSRLTYPVVATVLLCLAVRASCRALEWRSDQTLWQVNINYFPRHTKSYLNLAASYYNYGQPERALELLNANNNVPWLAVYSNYYQGRYYYDQHDYARAKTVLLKALAADVPEPLRYLGYIAEQEGDFLTAAQYYNKVLAKTEKYNRTERTQVTKRLEQVKKVWLDKYFASLRQQIAGNPNNKEARRELAINLDRLGFYQEALEQYLALEKSGVTSWQIYQNIANCYFNLNMADEAAQFYEKALALGGVSDDLLNNLGIVYRNQGKFEKSVKLLQQSTKQFPNSSYLLYNLGISYFKAGRNADAHTTFTEVNRLFPELQDRTTPYLQELTSE